MTKMRYRTDSITAAGDGALRARGIRLERSEDDEEEAPPAEPGDTWRITWHADPESALVAGYAICCPGCGQVHYWTTASNCAGKGPDGRCPHEGKSSCWEWTGSAEDGTLTASPSLLNHVCGWHGYLRDGVLEPA